jgi:hypothetical protein
MNLCLVTKRMLGHYGSKRSKERKRARVGEYERSRQWQEGRGYMFAKFRGLQMVTYVIQQFLTTKYTYDFYTLHSLGLHCAASCVSPESSVRINEHFSVFLCMLLHSIVKCTMHFYLKQSCHVPHCNTPSYYTSLAEALASASSPDTRANQGITQPLAKLQIRSNKSSERWSSILLLSTR